MTFGVDPEAVVGDPVPLVTALVEGLQVTQDLGESNPVCLATAQNDRDTYADRSEIRLGASLHTRELGETPLGDALWTVDSHPAFATESSRLELASDAILRPNQLAEVNIVLTNTGSDVAHAVRLRLYVSPEAGSKASMAPSGRNPHCSSAKSPGRKAARA